jgi:TolB-like protein/DNA-binding winged helix-turn-helix (wHTH) protein/Tfp pilus assembly protein PilF
MVLRDLAPDVFRFGHFTLEPQRRLLTIDGRAIPLSSRAFDILLLLVEQRERVVTKDEIFARVWPGTIVEENNLAVQISALRRALGEPSGDPKLVITVPGRGYRFVGTLEQEVAPAPGPLAEPVAEHPVVAALLPARRRISRPALAIAAGALILAILGARYGFRGIDNAPRLSIAVLPFRNLSGDTQQDYLADAISDDLTTDLSHIPGSTVIARESADIYKTHPAAAPEIGRALNVRYLLEGSLRIEANTFHVNAQLIDAPTSAHLWAARFDVTRDKLGAAQEEIVRHIASALNFTLVQVEAARSLHERPNNPDAVDFFLRARSMLDWGGSMARLMAAQGLLEKAVSAAPGFTDAMAELGLVLLEKIGGFDDPDEVRDHAEAKDIIEKAASLAPRSPAVVTAQGMLAFEDGRCEQAEPSFRLAISLDPNDVRAWNGLAHCSHELAQMQEMIDDFQHMLRIDPVNPGNPRRLYGIGAGYLMLGKPAEALDWFNKAGAGLSDDKASETPLGWQEWRRIYMIAATRLMGDSDRAAALYDDYRTRFLHRTVWQLSVYATHALSLLSGHMAYLRALSAAGMPMFAEEDEDFGVKPPIATPTGNDFDPTPLVITGARRIDTSELHTMLSADPRPIVIDVGLGAAVIPGAIWVWAQGLQGDVDHSLAEVNTDGRAWPSRPIVVMGDGPFGWRSYSTSLHLVAKGFSNVLWYRGGEQSWVAAGFPARDRRSP